MRASHVIPEVPKIVAYRVGKEYFDTSFAAESVAMKSLLSHNVDAAIIHDNDGRVHCTVCYIKDGIMLVWADGSSRKYKGVMAIYDKDTGKHVTTVAMYAGHIIEI